MNKKNESIFGSGDFVHCEVENFPKGWRLMQLALQERPKGIRQWITTLWGFDIFLWSVPFLKTVLAANVLVWIIFVFYKGG